MAIYRFEARVVKRSAGRSVTAAAAYRAAEELADERTGQIFDYTRRRGVALAEILAPDNTPDWMRDREQLWNAVERAEKRKDAQLAREIELALPHELTHEQRLGLVREFVRTEFVARGMIADLAVHMPDRQGDPRNHHTHVLLTMRNLTGEGFGPKARAWNEVEQLEEWRERWARAVNRALEHYGHEERVDHRSLAAQGINREPEPKQGPVATEMEREGKTSHAGDDRRAAQERNRQRAALEAAMALAAAELAGLRPEVQGDQSMIGQTATAPQAQALQDEEARRQQAREAEDLRVEAGAKEHAERQVEQADEMQRQQERLDDYRAQMQRQAEDARREEERKREAAAQSRAAEGEIEDARDRYRIALGENYDIRDPYGSLARAAMAEYASFIRERRELTQQIAQTEDPEERRALELRKEIESADYMAITSRRIAGQSEVITGRRSSEEAVRNRHQAADYEEQGRELRQQYRELQAARSEREGEQPDSPAGSPRPGPEQGQATGTDRRESPEAESEISEAEDRPGGPPTPDPDGVVRRRADYQVLHDQQAAPNDPQITGGDRKAEPAEDLGNAEVNEARARRMERLRNVSEEIEREHSDDEGRGIIRGFDPGGRSR